jgi:hypothetical protein
LSIFQITLELEEDRYYLSDTIDLDRDKEGMDPMFTCLDDADLIKLGPTVRSAIADLVAARVVTPPKAGAPIEVDGWFPLPSTMTPSFVDGVSQKSKSILRILAEHGGRVKWSDVANATAYEHWQELRGFLAGMNRRLRSRVDDPKAVLVGWDSSEDEYDGKGEWIDGYLKVHDETAKSLRRYFGLT